MKHQQKSRLMNMSREASFQIPKQFLSFLKSLSQFSQVTAPVVLTFAVAERLLENIVFQFRCPLVFQFSRNTAVSVSLVWNVRLFTPDCKCMKYLIGAVLESWPYIYHKPLDTYRTYN